MTHLATIKTKDSGASAPPVPDGGRVPLHQHFVPHFKSKSKSRANALVQEFLSRVFAGTGNSRFFKTFLLRFLFDGGSKSSDDCSGSMMRRVFAPAP